MGQKVNPNGLRLGINKTWSSRWYSKINYTTLLHEDLKIKKRILIVLIFMLLMLTRLEMEEVIIERI